VHNRIFQSQSGQASDYLPLELVYKPLCCVNPANWQWLDGLRLRMLLGLLSLLSMAAIAAAPSNVQF